MNNSISATYDSGTYILFTILMIIALILLSVILFFRIKKDIAYFSKRVNEKGLMPLDSFRFAVDKALSHPTKKLSYFFFQIDIRDYSSIIKTIGEEQYQTILDEQVSILQKLQPWGIKIGKKKEDSLLMLLRGDGQMAVESVCRLIISSLSKTYELSDNLSININVNVAVATVPEGGNNFDELNKSMDICIIVSRRKGVNRFALYMPQFGNETTDEYKFYQEIREAIKAKDFVLYYQPIVDTNSLEVVGAEALIRWVHRTKGVLPPSEFLHVMEQTGDINWVGMWCFEQMTNQLSAWRNNYEQRFEVAFNLSERQLLNPELAEELKKAIRKAKLDPTAVGVEISDMTMYNVSDIVKSNLDKIAALGMKICLDGFGTKFSSPTALQDLPVNSIKIDKSFWKQSDESSMVKSLLDMLVEYSKENSLRLIALGVENKEEMDVLREIGINYMQGYAFDKPKDPKEFIGDVVFTPWTSDLS